MDVNGEIYNMVLCSTIPENKDPIPELSLSLHFKALEYPELVGMNSDEMARLFEDGETKSVSFGRGAKILKGNYNIKIGEAFEFTGEQFSSAVVAMVQKIGAVIKLHITLPYSVGFLTWIPANFRKVIDISIVEVNEQMELPDQANE